MGDVGVIGVILSDYREMLVSMNNRNPTVEYEYGIQLIDLIIRDIAKQGIDLCLD